MIIENKSKFATCHSSGGHKRAISEMVSNPEVSTLLLETKVMDDVKAFQAFTTMLNNDPDRAYYGYNHVLKADEDLAIDTLMVTDTLFKSCDIATRTKYVKLCESVKKHDGKVHIFSSLHVSGEQLGQVSGIAAILRFPMPEEKILENDNNDSNDEDSDDSDSDDDNGNERRMNQSFQISSKAPPGVGLSQGQSESPRKSKAAAADSDSDSFDGDGASRDVRDMGL
eukprot:CAMPEP_0114347450 /NCGR_PEP_ID=MMETSP0101-20121206/13896_1 /TAXON_ID=38822 ORGANISM="Pteridomonas danica, Strain PT" /NCGR_SAMPLE_ID=MMETSP0101 /ASSEMBLY_ACC=CAM_ASM_000211 /LENGTH=225 /DNA_ID=CAMNT_0001484739 /DNA_START=666 /DNA_END=1343 /DNA_ORIENTATION=-